LTFTHYLFCCYFDA